MSVAVPLPDLAAAMQDYGFAYLMTVGDDQRVHAVAVRPRLEDGHLRVQNPGRRSGINADHRPAVSLVWPPREDGGYSLIVDGDAAMADEVLDVRPSRAVKHRPAAPDFEAPAGSCGSDCQPIELV